MGNNKSESAQISLKKDDKFLQNLQLYEEVLSETFGPIKILKRIEKPFRYYMLYRQIGINQQKMRLTLQEKMSWYSNLRQNKSIINIEYVDLKPTQDMCIQKICLDLYVRYYNYTLDMAISTKIKKFLRFKQADLAYILISLLSVGKTFNKMIERQASRWFDINNIFITPQGQIKIYPFPLNFQLKSGKGLSGTVQSPQKPSSSLLENEEVILNLSRKTSDGNSNSGLTMAKRLTDKDDILDIGFVMFQLLILNRQTVQVKLYSNQKISNILNLLQREGQIGSKLKQIVIKMICHYRQMKYQQIITILQQLQEKKDIQISNSIRLDEGTSMIESNKYQKNENLNQLSQHKQLKAGCISVVSSQKKRTLQRQ